MAEQHAALSVQVVHASPGRLRLRVPRAALENGALGRATQALADVAGIQQVRPNALASSLVVHYDDAVVGTVALLEIGRASCRERV